MRQAAVSTQDAIELGVAALLVFSAFLRFRSRAASQCEEASAVAIRRMGKIFVVTLLVMSGAIAVLFFICWIAFGAPH